MDPIVIKPPLLQWFCYHASLYECTAHYPVPPIMQLSRADQSAQRFYSMSAQIRKERKDYYDILEHKRVDGYYPLVELVLQCRLIVPGSQQRNTFQVLKSPVLEKHPAPSLTSVSNSHMNKTGRFWWKLNTSKWAKIAKTSPIRH